MKPNFALSLSFEGIGLLHRAFPGWNRVGEVALDSPDLPGALEVLRETAQQINGQDLTSKLIIPNEQIKYLSLDLGLMDEVQRTQAILKALDDATPYPVDQLVYDWTMDGQKTQIAAVARETLAEAEKFASDHGFGPVCFVAIPPPGQFAGEPFFGPTDHASALLANGDEVHRDMAPIKVTGVVRLPDPGDEETEQATPDASTSLDADIANAPSIETEPEQASAAVEALGPDAAQEIVSDSATIAPPLDEETEPDTESDLGSLGVSVLSDTLPSIEGEEAEAEPETVGTEATAAVDDVVPHGSLDEITSASDAVDEGNDSTPSFSTIRAVRDDDKDIVAPSLSGVRRNLEGLIAEPLTPAIDDHVESAPQPIEAEPESDLEHDVYVAAPAPELEHFQEPTQYDDDIGASDSNAEPPRGRLSFLSRRGSEMASGLAGGVRNSLANRSARRAGARAAEASFEPTGEPELVSERQRMTVFGARKAETEKRAIGGKPRYLGLMLTAILLVFLAGIAAWASIFMDDGLARLFAPREAEVAILPPGTADELNVEGDEAMVPAMPGDGPAIASLEAPEEPAEIAPLAQPNLPQALSEKEAQDRYAVTGVWQRAPQEPQLPDQNSLDDLYLTSIDPRVDAQDAVALPEIAALATDLVMGRVPLPAKRGSRFELDDRGLVVARAEGSLTPEGFLVFAGRPPSTPAAMPQRNEIEEPAVSAANERRAAIRPRVRPEGLIAQNERANLGGLTRSELAGKRPRTRPASIQLQAQAKRDQEESEAAAAKAAVESALAEAATATTPIETGTAQAVAESRKPKPRPRNFARVVEKARDSNETQEVTKVAAAVPQQQQTAPKIPSKSSVAKAATVRNQLNLRKINLIGVYGKPSSRRALVRLSNGRYKKVQVGDRIDGGRISTIGDDELSYQKNGRNVILKMPRG
ncbi:hypothetical protein LZG00_07190 [Rhodobacteraceae bacterium LMO-12]|nr:hypothetical protein [Rhodobacteraceae bacterium LMO-JJ12]